MEAVLQGHRRPFVFPARRARQRDASLQDARIAQDAAQRIAARQAQAVRRRNMTNPVLHYVVS